MIPTEGLLSIEFYEIVEVTWMSKFKKRDLERKGDKKQQILEKKLIDENLDSLTRSEGEVAELPDEE